jgi:hypothetical protein
MVSATLETAPKQRCFSAIAICGHKDGPVALGLCGTSLCVLREWRFFCNLGMAVIATASPSGLIPGGCKGGRVWRSSITNDNYGPDCVSAISSGVLVVKEKY